MNFKQKRMLFTQKRKIFILFQTQKRKVLFKKGEPMRNSRTHSRTIKRNLNKCKSVFNAYNDLQYTYGLKLENNPDIVVIECNVKLVGCQYAENYTTDF